jgi:hypothetical protein
VLAAARDIGRLLDEPPDSMTFNPRWAEQLSLMPRALQVELGFRVVSHPVADGVRFDLTLSDENLRWLEQRVGVPDPTARTEPELLDAVWKWMRPRVALDPLEKGAFVARGMFAQVALVDLAALKPPKLKGAPVALIHGFDVLFAGADDGPALTRIATRALETIGRENGPLVAEGRLLRQVDGAWQTWLPPGAIPVARAAASALLRRALETQYRQQEMLLGPRDPSVVFAPVHQLTDELTVSRWVEGRDALLPMTDAYTLVPREGDAVLLGGAALVRLLTLGLGALVSFDGQTPLAPARLTVDRFPTREELAAAQPEAWRPDPLECWFVR